MYRELEPLDFWGTIFQIEDYSHEYLNHYLVT